MDCKGLKGEELKKCQEKKKKNLADGLKEIESNRKIRQNKRKEEAEKRREKKEVRRLKRIEYPKSNPLGLKTLGTVTEIPRLK